MSALLIPKIITKTSTTKGGIIRTIIPRAVEFGRLNFLLFLSLKQQKKEGKSDGVLLVYEALMSERIHSNFPAR